MDGFARGFYFEEHMSTVTLSDVTRTPLMQELDRMFREYHQLIYRTAYGVTGSREDAQDIVQTIFLRLLRQEFQHDLKTNPKAYLYRAAVNLSLTTIQKRQRHVQIEATEHIEKIATDPSESDSAEDLHRRLYAAIAELDPDVAHTLVLRYVHRYSIAEIAKLLGKSRSAVAVGLFRSRVRLKQLIGVL